MKIDYEAVLNPSQLSVVLHEGGPALVVAGAGSGKTRTLVYRVARLVESGVEPGSILLLTFTRRAAEEMLSRAEAVLDSRCRTVDGGTFHSTANRILREFGLELDIPPHFTILDRSDSEEIVSWIRKDLGLNRKELRFPKKRTLAELFSRAVNVGVDLEELVLRQAEHLVPFLEDMQKIRDLYEEHKRRNALLDYDDLLVYFHRLLREVEWVRLALNTRYAHVLVDEFQDTNPIQNDLVELLAGSEQNVIVVGDDSQSIYSFRGARFQNIIEFPSRFPSARVIKLEENYRSTQPILDTANRIMEEARQKYTKCLFTRRSGGDPPCVWSAENEHAQSLLVADEIERLLEQGFALQDMAVLFRGSHHSYDLEIELAQRNLPFIKYGGMKFLEAAHIKDVLAHLRVVANRQDFFSWQRVLQLLEGVGFKTASRIIRSMQESSGHADPFAAFAKGRYAAGIRALKELLSDLGSIRGDPRAQVERVCAYYEPILKDKYDDYPKRLRQLEDLVSLARRFTRLSDFLAEVTLEPPNSERAGEGREGMLTLSTIHSAKGLEWRAVFVIWVAEHWFPHGRVEEDSEEMEEERRLLYVAVTRAKDRVYLVYPRGCYKWGEGTIAVQPSRFLRCLAPSLEMRTPYPREKRAFGTGAPERLGRPGVSLPQGGSPRPSLTGKRIRHPTFGEGVVIAQQGDDKITAFFDGKGMVTLKLAFAPIEIRESET